MPWAITMSEAIPMPVPREHYIPLRKADLVRRLCDSPLLSDDDRDAFARFAQLLDATFHHRFHTTLERLKDRYAAFDPDRDTFPLADGGPGPPEPAAAAKLFEEFGELLAQANFRELSEEQLETALNERSDVGVHLHLDLNRFERFAIFVRGESYSARQRRIMWKAWRLETFQVPVYQRVAVIFRLKQEEEKGSRPVYVKLFKEIPQADLEMLLPGTRVKLTLFDRGKILLPAISGLAMTAYKLIRGAVVIALVGASGILATLGLLGGTLGYAAKSFMSYLKAKDKYQLHLTRSLYFQNLDNNAGVMHRLLDEAEEQEVREAALAYFLLWQQAGIHGWTAQQCDEAAERWLTEACGRDVDFEVDDALIKLAQFELIEVAGENCVRAVPIHVALRRLDAAWVGLFPYSEAVSPPTQRRAS